MENISVTELINPLSSDIDIMDTLGILRVINNEDKKIAEEISKNLDKIAEAVDVISENFLKGGRLFYFGAGTSGRLGVLDASECPPTFSTEPSMVQGIIAGGDSALRNAIEGAEDSLSLAQEDFYKQSITKNDTVVVISASGNANYVVEIINLAKKTGAKTIALSSNKNGKINIADIFICIETGAEVLTGSTRMKAGTAQKLVLNMLTTASMIKTGKIYKNYMIDVKPTNDKLKKRAVRIVSSISEKDENLSKQTLEENGYKIKPAILKLKYNIDFGKANELLEKHNGILRKVFKELD